MAAKIKICGITRLADGEHAIACGADFLGLIFVPGTPRCITEADAQPIARSLKGKAKLVGVFRNEQLAVVNSIASRLGLDFVQCHGQEDADYCNGVVVPVIKTIELDGDTNLVSAKNIAHYLLDKPKPQHAKDHGLQATIAVVKPMQNRLGNYFLAGGLTPSNVGFALTELQPYAVDVCSGVEMANGVKDDLKVEQFCRNCGEATCKKQA